MVEKHIEDDPGIAPPLGGKTRQGLEHHRVAVGEDIDAPVQRDSRFQLRGKAPVQAAFDEVAVQAAQQLLRLLTAKMEVREIVHGLKHTTPAHIDITRYSDLHG
ncbi:hypothetical protein D3C76_761520 [compost metagenome]